MEVDLANCFALHPYLYSFRSAHRRPANLSVALHQHCFDWGWSCELPGATSLESHWGWSREFLCTSYSRWPSFSLCVYHRRGRRLSHWLHFYLGLSRTPHFSIYIHIRFFAFKLSSYTTSLLFHWPWSCELLLRYISRSICRYRKCSYTPWVDGSHFTAVGVMRTLVVDSTNCFRATCVLFHCIWSRELFLHSIITDETILTGDDADFRVNISTVRDRTDDVCSDEIAARELRGQSRKWKATFNISLALFKITWINKDNKEAPEEVRERNTVLPGTCSDWSWRGEPMSRWPLVHHLYFCLFCDVVSPESTSPHLGNSIMRSTTPIMRSLNQLLIWFRPFEARACTPL